MANRVSMGTWRKYLSHISKYIKQDTKAVLVSTDTTLTQVATLFERLALTSHQVLRVELFEVKKEILKKINEKLLVIFNPKTNAQNFFSLASDGSLNNPEVPTL